MDKKHHYTPAKGLGSKIQSEFVGQKVLPRQEECVVLSRMINILPGINFVPIFISSFSDALTTSVHNQT